MRKERQRLAAVMLGGILAVSLALVDLDFSGQESAIYDDQIQWANWSWHTSVANVASPVYDSNQAMEVRYNAPWAALSLRYPGHNTARDTGFDTSPFTHLQFALHPDGNPFPAINASLYDSDGHLIRQVEAAPYATPQAGGWFLVSIRLDDLGGANRVILRVQLQDGLGEAQPAFYVDSMKFVAENG